MAYRNPVVPGFHPDPSVCVVGSTFYLATSTFEYFPGVPIYASEDLVTWRSLGHALNRRSQLDMRVVEASGGIFAPTLRYHKGRWYMTTCCTFKMLSRTVLEAVQAPRGFYVWTDDITDESRWSEPVWFDATGIDQDVSHPLAALMQLFFDEDGQTYMSWATHEPQHGLFTAPGKFNLSVYTVPIDIGTGDSLAPARLVRRNRTTGNWVAEGPHIFRRGPWYYLITAEGGTEVAHQEWVSRSRSPLGPWEVPNAGAADALELSAPVAGSVRGRPINPMVFNDDDPDVQMTGHMDMVEGPDGRWWAFCLAVRPQEGRLSQLGRETFLCPVEWVDDWPVVNGGRKVSLIGDAAAGLPKAPAKEAWNYGFTPDMGGFATEEELTPDLHREGWYFLRTPQKPFASLTSHPGALALKGGPYTLEVDENVSMVARKQTAFTGRWEVEFEATPAPGEAAGVAVWWSKWAHAALFLRGTEGGRELVFRAPVEEGGDGFSESATPFEGTKVTVIIDARPDRYTFSVEGKEVGVLPATRLVQNRAYDSIMTGTFLALFAHGAVQQGCLQPALFHRASWEGALE